MWPRGLLKGENPWTPPPLDPASNSAWNQMAWVELRVSSLPLFPAWSSTERNETKRLERKVLTEVPSEMLHLDYISLP